jgi:hypothetical protein
MSFGSVMEMGSMNLLTLTLDWDQKTSNTNYYLTKTNHLSSLYQAPSSAHPKE